MKATMKKHNRMMRLWILVFLMVVNICAVHAGKPKGRPPFDPQKFQADLEQFITTDAGLKPEEAAKFFPVYRQMMKKMRMLFDEMRRYHHVNPCDEEACADAVRKQDEIDLELKRLQQEYHQRFMLMLPPSKVLSIIKAEEKFHRQAFQKFRDGKRK